MQGIMEKRQEKGFINIDKQLQKFFWIVLCVLFISCDADTVGTSEIPFVPFADVEINLRNQIALPLNSRGYIEVDGGVRGIIVYKDPVTQNYVAFEKNCSYEPNEACATVGVDVSGLFMVDSCCGSEFSFPDGIPVRAPASLPLRRYRTVLNGNFLIITDEPLN